MKNSRKKRLPVKVCRESRASFRPNRFQDASARDEEELLARVLGLPIERHHEARMLLEHFGGLARVAQADVRSMRAVQGITPDVMGRLLAVAKFVEAGRYQTVKPARAASDVAPLLISRFGSLSREVFGIVLLDASNNVQGFRTISIGIADQSLVHPREVFKEAILAGAVKVLLFHNHPSGNLTPSREDEELTWQLVRAGKLLGIPVVDHLIVTAMGYFSFHERGML